MTTSIGTARRVLGDGVGQPVAQAQPGFVDRDPVHHRVGPGQVDVLERARDQHRILGALPREHLAAPGDEDRLARRDIPNHLVAAALEHQRFTGHHPLGADEPTGALAEDQWADAERVAKGQQAVPGDQRDGGVRALDPLVQPLDRVEHLVGVEVGAAYLLLQLVRQHVDQQLGVGVGVEVPTIDVEQLVGEFARVGQVAVVHQHDAVRRVHVERLSLLLLLGVAPCGIAHVAQAHRAEQAAHVAGAVRLAHLALGLLHVDDAAVGGRDARRILAAMLQQGERVVDLLIDGARRDDADDAAHVAEAPRN